MHELVQAVLTNIWVQLTAGLVAALGAVAYRHRMVRVMRTFFRYLFSQKKLAEENVQLKEDLHDAEVKNKEWDSIIEDIEKRHQAVLRELEESKKDISRLKEIRRQNSDKIRDLEIDLTQLLTWGRLLTGQLVGAGLTPGAYEPELLTKTKKE